MVQLDSPLSNGLTSILLFPQSILLSVACRYQARRSPRSGQPSFRRLCMRVLPRLSCPPPSRKYILRNKPGMEIWILVRGVSASTYLSVLPADTACGTDPRRICVLFSFVYILYILLVSHCAVLIPTFYFFYFGYNYRIFIIDRNSYTPGSRPRPRPPPQRR